MEEWRAQVDQLVADTRETCLAAKTSSDLDALLVRCAALQMQRMGQDNVFGQRTTQKLNGLIFTLENWMRFLDFRAAGNAPAANEALRRLFGERAQFPVLTQPEIQTQFMPEPISDVSPPGMIKHIYGGLRTPGDLPAAIERLNSFTNNPMTRDNTAFLTTDKERLEGLRRASELLNRNEVNAAIQEIERAILSTGYSEGQKQFESVRDQLTRQALTMKLSALLGMQPKPEEDLQEFIARALIQLQEKGDYSAMLDVIRSFERLAWPGRGSPLATDRVAIQRFLAAQRFESVGDAVAAVNDYRHVVGTIDGKYAPIKEATAALERLKSKNPEAFTNYEGVVLDELRSVREQLQKLRRDGMMGRPTGF